MTRYALKADRCREPIQPAEFFILYLPKLDAFIGRSGDRYRATTDWDTVAKFEMRGEAHSVSGQLLATQGLLALDVRIPGRFQQ